MIKQKKNILLIAFFLIILLVTLKLLDYFLQKKYGLGSPIIYQKSRIFGYSLKPNQETERRGKKIKINNMGMRSSSEWNFKNDNIKKILFFGDSVTYGGSIVNNSDLFSEKICAKLNLEINKFQCGNLGVNGYNVYSIIRNIKYKKINNEDLIVITIIANDFVRSFHNIISQPFWSKTINNSYPAFSEIFFIYLDKFRNRIKYNLGDEKQLTDIDKIYYNDLIDELYDVLETNNKPYIIFYSPTLNEIKNEEDNNFFIRILENKFENISNLKNISYKNKNEIYFDHVHLNKIGHEIYSEYMKDKIKNILEE
tara:strand:+ start:1468 stop:2400 length:933 start_codon:yes stop_codon:yes gene_type:complete